MTKSKHYIALAIVSFFLYSSGIAVAMENDGMTDQQELQHIKVAKVSLVDAIKKTEVNHPGSKVISAEFEIENGKPAYSLEVESEKGETEVTIDAMTGATLPDDAD